MSKVTLSGYILVPEADREAVAAALPVHIDATRGEPGCLVFEVTRADEAGRFDVYEEFVDRGAFEAHQARVKASEWGAVTARVERHYTVVEE